MIGRQQANQLWLKEGRDSTMEERCEDLWKNKLLKYHVRSVKQNLKFDAIIDYSMVIYISKHLKHIWQELYHRTQWNQPPDLQTGTK